MWQCRVSGILLTLPAVVLSLACGQVSHDTEASNGGSTAQVAEKVEMLTFWREGSELDALNKLIEIHEARRPNAEVTPTFHVGTYADAVMQSFTYPNPPDTFHANMGQRFLKWVAPDQVYLEPVTRGDWDMPAALLDVNSKDGVLYGVPISLIRQASFFYNPGLLESYGIDVDDLNQPGMAGVQALLDACETMADSIEPFALGNVYDWTLDMLFWEALFPAIVGPEYYERFWRGEADPDNDPELDAALAVLLELSQYFNADSATVDFPEVLPRIAEGEHAFGQQGDWGYGMLIGAGYTDGVDFGMMPFPGTSDIFIFSQDVFPMVAGTPNRAATQEFLNTIASEEAQVEFNTIRGTGTLPALRGIDIHATALSDAQKATYEHFNSAASLLPAVHGFKPDDVLPDLGEIEKTMIETQDTSELKEYLTANYGLLGQ